MTINNSDFTNVGAGDGSDGELIFTTGTKSYGNLVETDDYTVDGETLNLMLHRVYQFTNMEIGPDTFVTTENTTGSTLYILVQGTANISGIINLSDKVITGDNTWTFSGDGNDIDSPGVEAGGAGGNDVGTTGGAQGSGFGGGGAGGVGDSGYPPYGGTGGTGGTPIGSGGASIDTFIIVEPPFFANGNAGGTSAGGSGSNYFVDSGAGDSGAGGDGSYGTAGSAGVCGASKCASGGGGGSGGEAGKAGIHFYLKSYRILFSGSIDTSGTDGTNGGTGGSADLYRDLFSSPKSSNGGTGGGGGGGGNAGDIAFYYGSLTDSGDKFMDKGSGGTGGTGGTDYGGGGSGSGPKYSTPGGTATAGSVGTIGTDGTYIPDTTTFATEQIIKCGESLPTTTILALTNKSVWNGSLGVDECKYFNCWADYGPNPTGGYFGIDAYVN